MDADETRELRTVKLFAQIVRALREADLNPQHRSAICAVLDQMAGALFTEKFGVYYSEFVDLMDDNEKVRDAVKPFAHELAMLLH